MKDDGNEQRNRIQVDFDLNLMKILEEIKKSGNFRSNAVILGKALKVYYWIYKEIKNGAEISIKKDGKEKLMVFVDLE